MTSSLALGIAATALAGWVDAVAIAGPPHVFVSFMSGNSTETAVAAVSGTAAEAMRHAAVIGMFFVGALLGEFLGDVAGRRRGPVTLSLMAGLLAAAWAGVRPGPVLALAMGVANAALHRAGPVEVHVAYVTGTLVQAARALAASMRGRGRWSACLPLLGLWAGLFAGGLAGVLALGAGRTLAYGAPVAWALLLAIVTSVRPSD